MSEMLVLRLNVVVVPFIVWFACHNRLCVGFFCDLWYTGTNRYQWGKGHASVPLLGSDLSCLVQLLSIVLFIHKWSVLVRLVPFGNDFVCLGTLVPIDTSESRLELMLAICVVAHLFPYSNASTRVLVWLCWVTQKCYHVIVLSLYLLFSVGLCLFWGCEVLTRFWYVVFLIWFVLWIAMWCLSIVSLGIFVVLTYQYLP
jgi:hypothetical protein